MPTRNQTLSIGQEGSLVESGSLRNVCVIHICFDQSQSIEETVSSLSALAKMVDHEQWAPCVADYMDPQKYNATVMEMYLSIVVSWVNRHICLANDTSPRVGFVPSTILDQVLNDKPELDLYASARKYNCVKNVRTTYYCCVVKNLRTDHRIYLVADLL